MKDCQGALNLIFPSHTATAKPAVLERMQAANPSLAQGLLHSLLGGQAVAAGVLSREASSANFCSA